MTKLTSLTFTAILCCFAAMGQQTNDSTADSQLLPVKGSDSLFSHFSCLVKEYNKILVQWNANSIGEGDYFVVEHSNDGEHYETVGALKGMHDIAAYELTDNAPFKGSNYYRVKYAGKTEQAGYSKTVRVILSQDAAFKFYPNPVDKLLIIQIDHAASLQILSSLGIVRISKALQPGVQVINVSTLEKGSYLLRVTDKESNRDILEQLLKN